MTFIEAKSVAQRYVEEMGEILPGFKFGIGDSTEFINKYYFDFIWLTLHDQIPIEPPLAGGACGLTVTKKDNQVRPITYAKYCELQRNENELNEMYQMLSDFKNNKKNLTEIKAIFNLNSEQLLELSKIVKAMQFDKTNIYEVMNMIQKIKSQNKHN